MSPLGWVLCVAGAVWAAQTAHPVLAFLLGAFAMTDAVVTAFRWMGYGR